MTLRVSRQKLVEGVRGGALAGLQAFRRDLITASVQKALAAEMMATALFVFVGVGSIVAFLAASGPATGVVDGLPVIALAHGLVFGLLILGIGHLSGGHINPAISFAMVVMGRISLPRGLLYIVAQMIGACIGMAALRLFVRDEALLTIPGAGGQSVRDHLVVIHSAFSALGLEAVGTFLLVWTYFAASGFRSADNLFTLALFTGFALVVLVLFLFPLTGAGLNPARTFGPALINNRWDDWWVYYLGPLLGASLAAISYWFMNLRDVQQRPA